MHDDKWRVPLVLVGFERAAPPGSARLRAPALAIPPEQSGGMPGWLKPYAAWESAILTGGYRLTGSFLQGRGWQVNLKRIPRVWQQQGLGLPSRTRRRKFRNGCTIQPKGKIQHDVWSWDFVHDTYGHREPFRCLTVKDEATRLGLAMAVGRSLTHQHVIEVLRQLMARYGRPQYLRRDNGSELVAHNLTTFLKDQKIIPSRIEPGNPWQNGRNESLNGTFRRECLDAELFESLAEARVVSENWRRLYNHERPHSALGYQVPAAVFKGAMTRKT